MDEGHLEGKPKVQYRKRTIYVYKDKDNNRFEFACPSKSAGKKRLQRMFPGRAFWFVETKEKEIAEPLQNDSDKIEEKKDFKPTSPIRSFRIEQRNKPCSCGSGKKYKHCCLRRKR